MLVPSSIVSFIPDRRAVPAQRLQQFAVRLDHFREAADVGMHIGAHADNLSQMLLHISAQSLPFVAGTAERRQKMEVVMIGRQLIELCTIVEILLAPRAKQQPELTSLMTVVFREHPLQHRTKRSDPGSCGDEHGATRLRMQNETAKRSLKRNFRTFFKIAEIVRHESILHAIQAESEASIFRRGRRDRISARHLFPFGSVGLYRKPLSRNKAD